MALRFFSAKLVGLFFLSPLLLFFVLSLFFVLIIAGTAGVGMAQHIRSNSQLLPFAERLLNEIRIARQFAQHLREKVTFCLHNGDNRCTNVGTQTIVFIDRDRDRMFRDNDVLLSRGQSTDNRRAVLSASRRAYLRFHPNGHALEFGNIIFCAALSGAVASRKIVIRRDGYHYIRPVDTNSTGMISCE